MNVLFITLGDPLSINIECVAELLPSIPASQPVVMVGSLFHWREQLQMLGHNVDVNLATEAPQTAGLWFIDISNASGQSGCQTPTIELTPAERGLMGISALREAAELAKQYARAAVLTAPIDKKAAVDAGFEFHGQTEFFESAWDSKAVMLLAGEKLRVGLATNHLALKDVSSNLSAEKISKKLTTLDSGLRDIFGISAPRIGVCGLNPHASDHGLFGSEEAELIIPAIATAKESGINAAGPYPADTLFYRAYNGEFDAVLAMYHDQGLGPLKLVHFDTAVNISLGLRYLRVSPDHGPASDLFLKNQASKKSFIAALKQCLTYLERP
jgi:4-hydroxythreonine-4-phosphate dehydrogenase